MTSAKPNPIRIWACRLLLASFAMTGIMPAAQAALVISTAATSNVNCSAGSCVATAPEAVLNVGDLGHLLAASDFTLKSGATAQDIVFGVPFRWTGGNALTLDAFHSIRIDRLVSDAGSGALAIATNDGGFGGDLSFGEKGHVTFSNTANALTIDGKAYVLAGSIATLASAVAADPSGNYALAHSYDAKSDGAYSGAPIYAYFSGRFEGLGNRISHLRVNSTGQYGEVGLFSWVNSGGTLRNLGLVDTNIVNRGDTHGSNVGALASLNLGVIANCFATGRIVSWGEPTVGGLVGNNYGGGFILNSHASVKILIPGKGAWAGGLAGINTNPSMIGRSYATGSVSVNGRGGMGGLVGLNVGTIVNSYATGAVLGGQKSWAGGLAGANSAGTIQTSYSTGAVAAETAKHTQVGGLVGDNAVTSPILKSVWDTTASGVENCTGHTDSGIDCTGLTTGQLQSALPAGFDPTVWGLNPAINGGYPYLLANPPQ